MLRRLVVGRGPVGRAAIDAAGDRPGRLSVVTDDSGWVSTLRERNVPADDADPADPASYPEAADVVVVSLPNADRTLDAVGALRGRFPSATIVAEIGSDATDTQRESIASSVDETVDTAAALAGRAIEAGIESGGERLGRLHRTLRGLSGRLAVIAHDNPDPDAIASAIGLRRIASTVGVDADACYFGDISHQQNRAFVNLLELRLRNLERFDPDEYAGVALVDHSRAGVNDSLPGDTPVDIVVDHHPPTGPVEGAFVDLRSEVGATSTLLAEYLKRLGIEPGEPLATALLYGIRVDTRGFVREVAPGDFSAAAFLLRHVDRDALDRIESPSVGGETFGTIARAIAERDVRGGVLVSCVGRIENRDALAQAAEQLVEMEGVSVALVCGYRDGVVYVSARARGADVDLGEVLREAFGGIGSAGGHADMAGAQLRLGILTEVDAGSDRLEDIVEDVVAERFFEVIGGSSAGRDGVADR